MMTLLERFEAKYIPEPNSGPERKRHSKIVGKPCKNCGGIDRYGGSYSCIACTDLRAKENKQTAAYKRTAKRYWMRKRYGMTPEEMEKILTAQGGRCALCGTDDPGHIRGWVIDHNHETGALRGILCDACNVGLGRFGEDPEKLLKAIQYLEYWSHVQ